MIGVGPLESYIEKGGAEALTRVEAAAAASPSMLIALTGVPNQRLRDRLDRFLAAHGQKQWL